MAKLTLLDMVQTILTSMDSDDVNTISQTEESLQVVDMIEATLFELYSQREWPHLKNTCQLESLADVNFPTTLKLPDLVGSIDCFKYDITEAADTNKKYRDLKWLEPCDFVDMTLERNTSDTDVDIVNVKNGNTPIWIKNDVMPTWWTSFDDEHATLDSYDKNEESTVQGVNTIVHCVTSPSFTASDTFVPDLPEKAFPLLLAESQRACHIFLKQQDSPLDAKRALRGMNRLKDKDWRAHSGKKTLNFGRK